MNHQKLFARLLAVGLMSVIGFLLVFADVAQGASPTLSRIMPRGGQRGTEVDFRFTGARLDDAKEIMFYTPGFEVVSFKTESATVTAVKVRIKSDCQLGEHLMRVRTAGGITDAKTFYVGPYPTVVEKEPNSDFATPQPIAMNSTVEGVVKAEDVDYYVVDAKKGDRISAEVEGIRLGITMFDAYVAIMDIKRFELSANDDSALHLQDPVASVIAPADGKYVIQVRESSYAGSDSCLYRVHIGNFPRPRVVFPAGGKAGTQVAVKYIGDVTGDITQTVKLPAKPDGRFPLFLEHQGHVATSANLFRVSDLENVIEKEPNDSSRAPMATGVTLPAAFNGIIDKDGDNDWYKFSAKKGQRFSVRCYARTLRSPLDPVLYIYNAKDRKTISGNDDSGGPDSLVAFTVPADGEYLVRVFDHLRKGSPQHVYRIEFQPRKATLTTQIPEYRRYSQDRNAIFVPRGNRYATLVRVVRANVGGDVVLSAPQMPKGMTMHADTMTANVNTIPVVFEAAPDAPLVGTLMPLNASLADTSKGITGGFDQTIGLVYGQPNNTAYYATRADRVACSVIEAVPFKLQLVQPKSPIVRNGSKRLKVVVQRKEGFTAAITLRMLWKPPGIGSSSSVQIPKGKNEAYYTLSANSSAPIQNWKIAIVGSSNAGKGTSWVSTQLAELQVQEPFVSMAVQMAACERPNPANLLCKVNQLRPFEGEAKVILHGLPALVTAETREKMITKASTDVTFNLKTDPKTPVGQHKTLFCQVVVNVNGEPVIHNVGGGGTLRVDPPPPAPKKPVKVAAKPAAPKPAVKAPPKKPVVKQLTRLEKLRLEAKKRAEQQK